MKCWECRKQLINEADVYENGRAAWWLCEQCHVARELEPYDIPETAAERAQWDTLFKGKKYPQRLSETIDALLVDLKAELKKREDQQQEPEA